MWQSAIGMLTLAMAMLNTGGCARPSAVNKSSFHVAQRQLQPNDALSNSPGIDTTLLDPAVVFVAKFSGPSQLELSTQRDRISYPWTG